MSYFIAMPDLRLARLRMKTGNERGRLEGFLLLFVAVIIMAFRESFGVEQYCFPFTVGSLVILAIVAVIYPRRRACEEAGRPGLGEAERDTTAQEMRAVYAWGFFTFMVLVLSYIWVQYVGMDLNFFTQYADYVFLGGTALICLLIILAHKIRE